MKKSTLTIVMFLTITIAISQTPDGFKYQAVARDTIGELIQNQLVAFRISLIQGSMTDTLRYTERHTPTTNNYGLANLEIGFGQVLFGSFTSIDWSAGQMYMKIELDPAGGTAYQNMGTSQLLSVPYALNSKTSEKIIPITEAARDTMTNIPIGTNFLNTTTNKLNFFDGIHWNEVSSICLPQATQANAGADQLNISGATVILQANTPLVGTGEWQIVDGIDGYITDIYSDSTEFSGLAGTTYTLSWVITNSCGSNSDEVAISFSPFTCGSTFKDVRDNTIYQSVLIGSQCWMADNMNIGTRIDGIETQLNNGILEKYCHNNLDSLCTIYGGLYTWHEMMQYSTTPGTQGICASGWHVPTDDEWKTLEGNVDSQYGVGDPVWDLLGDRGLDAGGKLKQAGTTNWVWPNTGATNSSGFTALPAGSRNTDGSYPGFQIFGRFWSSNENGSTAYRRALIATRADISRDVANKFFGFSVRCLKD